MRNSIIALALMATPAAAQGQVSAWNFVQSDAETNGMLLAFVEAPDGNQFVIKCEAPGKRSVFAMFSSDDKLGPPGQPAIREVAYRFDGGKRNKSNWYYYEYIVVALHTTRDRQLELLLREVGDSTEMEITIDPVVGRPIISTFNITGAQDAIARVFESCEDENLAD